MASWVPRWSVSCAETRGSTTEEMLLPRAYVAGDGGVEEAEWQGRAGGMGLMGPEVERIVREKAVRPPRLLGCTAETPRPACATSGWCTRSPCRRTPRTVVEAAGWIWTSTNRMPRAVAVAAMWWES